MVTAETRRDALGLIICNPGSMGPDSGRTNPGWGMFDSPFSTAMTAMHGSYSTASSCSRMDASSATPPASSKASDCGTGAVSRTAFAATVSPFSKIASQCGNFPVSGRSFSFQAAHSRILPDTWGSPSWTGHRANGCGHRSPPRYHSVTRPRPRHSSTGRQSAGCGR
jgi:hypothetical protein